jgi:rhodanese-related sulfurtransferase
MLKTIAARAVPELKNCHLLDVRTPGEYAAVHIAGSRLVPLDQLDAAALRESLGGQRCVVVCQSGMRARRAAEQLEAVGIDAVVLDGGVAAWQQAGMPVERGASGGLPLQRQVFLVIGAMALAGGILALTVDPKWVWLSMFAGAGLLMAGATGFCPLALLMAKMPWNQAPKASADSCCSKGSCCS